MNITNGGTVNSGTLAYLGDQLPGNFTVTLSGAGSKWIVGSGLGVGVNGTGTLDIQAGTLLSIGVGMDINSTSTVTLNGGTLRLNTLTDANNRLVFNSGTFQLGSNRTIGTDSIISRFYGLAAAVPTGKGLTVEGAATIASGSSLTIAGGTFKSNGLTVASGGVLDFDRGVFELTGGTIAGLTNLTVPTGGEFRASGVQPVRVVCAAGSTITATGALTLGDAAAVNGFYSDGNLSVGTNAVTLLDANDVAFDTGALVTLGSGASPGTLSAANGLALDFGGNVTGVGTITTPNNIAKPLINNGHISGNSAAQKITLSGYVKGVGTFDNVTTTGTFSPGLSPAIVQTTNLSLAPSSTLVMELGSTAAGSGYDQIQDAAQLALAGTLQVSLINSFAPAAENSFDLFNWATLSGAFSSLNLPALPGGLTWNTSQLYTTGVLSVASAGTPGDYNNNGSVDAADYVLWRKYQGTTHALPNDPTGGTIGPTQYATWRANFGRPPGSGSSDGLGGSSVPEPASWIAILLATGLISYSCRDRR
jgi:T5SS/PEP-CTERM-associated repeat protein